MYPVLHEFGHSLPAIFLGADITEFHIFPLPNVLCDGSSLGNIALAFIGIGGMLIPFLFSFVWKPKCFSIWYIFMLIKGISALAFALSIISLIGYNYGMAIKNDDIITVLEFCPDAGIFCGVVMFALLALAIYSLCVQKPLTHIYKYFGITEK